jgi:uncharacterized protein YjbI with pentapeptide repeats
VRGVREVITFLYEANSIIQSDSVIDLSDADLRGAHLTGAFLGHANLDDAEVTDEQLALCLSLAGATMPDGTKHP